MTLRIIIGLFLILLVGGVSFFYYDTFHPKPLQPERVVSSPQSPRIAAGSTLTLLSWNVQSFQGSLNIRDWAEAEGVRYTVKKNHLEVQTYFKEIARTIRKISPDIIVLQGLDAFSERTYEEDQLEELLRLLPAEYASYVSSYYWKTPYNPYTGEWMEQGQKLALISRFAISQCLRHQLANNPRQQVGDWFRSPFEAKRALLEVSLPLQDGRELHILNTQLSLATQKPGIFTQQWQQIQHILERKNQSGISWIMASSIFHLPSPLHYDRLPENHKRIFIRPQNSLVWPEKYYTYPKADPNASKEESFTYRLQKDNTTGQLLDYMIWPEAVKQVSSRIYDKDIDALSNHFPLILTFRVPQ